MSFFDDADQSRRSRPRRAAGGTVAAPDPQTARTRQAVAAGAILLVVILLVVGVRGCLNSQKKSSLREYTRNVSALVQQSDNQVSRPFFEQLSGTAAAAGDSVNLETQVNQLRIVAEDEVSRARRLDVPDEMKPAQGSLVLALEMRRDGLRRIAAKLPTAQGTGTASQTAVQQIAGQMLQFLASDVIYSQRVIPQIKKALTDNEITGQTIASSHFLPTIAWLDASALAGRLGAQAPANANGPVAPGSHGHALTSVSVNGTDLSPDTANRLTAGSRLTFTVKLANQGDNNESNVAVRLSIEGAGAPVTAQATVPQTAKGSESSVDIPVAQAPPIGTPVTVNVSIQPVPGEKTLDNNKQSFPAIFTRG